jgi:hypothetical protein
VPIPSSVFGTRRCDRKLDEPQKKVIFALNDLPSFVLKDIVLLELIGYQQKAAQRWQ